MSIKKPYHRIYKPNINVKGSDWAYIVHKKYANSPEHYLRAFQIIQNDLKKLFEYVEPADCNLKTYSFKIHELLIRTCIEIEANFKAILKENDYKKKEEKWGIKDYNKVNLSHRLDSYNVTIPIWNGHNNDYIPFADWKEDKPLLWYQAYNKSKHDRHKNFQIANFEHLMNAVTGLFVLLTSQFRDQDFNPGTQIASFKTDSYYKGDFGIGDFFIITYPDNWRENEKYDFDWNKLKDSNNPFEKYNYNS